jgi:hypothetical protein
MKKIFICVVTLSFIFNAAMPQTGEWVWIHGSNAAASTGNFGTQGVPSPSNEPPALYEACEWTDINGNLWIHGGYNNTGRYGALWKYDVASNEWTWMKGPSTTGAGGVYGVRGVPSPANYPTSNSHGALSWTDNHNCLWMFGGGNGSNALWKYDIATNQWTWMKGPMTTQPAVYGMRGVPDTANIPGARWEAAAAWTDNYDNLWFFGGTYNNSNLFNDVWRFNIPTNTWTWMKGSSLFNQPGEYGTLGVEDTANTPGGRIAYCRWKDKSGNFWLFGGGDNVNYFYQNDLWRFNPLTNNWTWMSGSNIPNADDVYGTRCVALPTNVPGSRIEDRAAWTDAAGNLYMLGGGAANSSSGGNFAKTWNDLWKYCTASNKWIWVDGDSIINPSGDWGTLGVPAPSNMPMGRAGAVGSIDLNGNLYLFGGAHNPFLVYNDLWKYTPDNECGICLGGTGISKNDDLENGFSILPNPAHNIINVECNASTPLSVTELKIYDVAGRVVYENEIGNWKFEIRNSFSPGLYFVQVRAGEKIWTQKLMIE